MFRHGNDKVAILNNNGEIPQALSVLGVNVTPFKSYDHALECVSDRIRDKNKMLCIAINPIKVYKAKHDTELSSVLSDKTNMYLCDGVGIAYALRLLLGRSVKRCTGIQLFFDIIERACQTRWRIFLLGASEKSNERACLRLRQEYPNLKIVGQHHGYFTDDDAIIEQINLSQADVLFAAMGSPLQEYWLSKHKHSINTSFLMGIGGTLDVVSGVEKWAPRVFRQSGTEFIYRLVKDPKRWREQSALPKFVLWAVKAKFERNSRQF